MALLKESKEPLKHQEPVNPSQPSLEDTDSDFEAAKCKTLIDPIKRKKGQKNEIPCIHGQGTSGRSPNMKKKGSKEETQKKERRSYSLPGQKHDPPDERHPLRIFYESLYQQNPESEMAEIWMLEHGLLEPDDAKEAFERRRKTLANQKVGTAMTATTSTAKFESGRSSTSKRSRDPDEDDNEDFVLKSKKRKCDI